jgi:hypothetical protein
LAFVRRGISTDMVIMVIIRVLVEERLCLDSKGLESGVLELSR